MSSSTRRIPRMTTLALEAPPETGYLPGDITVSVSDTPLRLNIGCSDKLQPGETGVDRTLGSEAYPLDYPDNAADSIYASHVLEHFPHEKVGDVLTDWVRVLKPGGTIKIA